MRHRNLRESTTTTSSATSNYDLPQWNGEDVTSWMTNLNDAFNKIDSAMWANHTAMAGYDKIASDLQKLADGIKVDNAEIREALRIVQQGMADQLTQLNQAKTDITNANLAISQLQTKDNALSAMIKDLQDDVGMSMGWREWITVADESIGISGTVTYRGSSYNWHVENVYICNGALQINVRTENSENLVLAIGVDFIVAISNEDTNKILEAVYSKYPYLGRNTDELVLASLARLGKSATINSTMYTSNNGIHIAMTATRENATHSANGIISAIAIGGRRRHG